MAGLPVTSQSHDPHNARAGCECVCESVSDVFSSSAYTSPPARPGAAPDPKDFPNGCDVTGGAKKKNPQSLRSTRSQEDGFSFVGEDARNFEICPPRTTKG